jgi:hypothetical protein
VPHQRMARPPEQARWVPQMHVNYMESYGPPPLVGLAGAGFVPVVAALSVLRRLAPPWTGELPTSWR